MSERSERTYEDPLARLLLKPTNALRARAVCIHMEEEVKFGLSDDVDCKIMVSGLTMIVDAKKE